MAIDFTVKDILHRIQVRFIHAFLPEAKKPYNLKAVHQPELDIHGIASKAEIIAVNEPRTLKVIVPALERGSAYRLAVITHSSAKNSGSLLKKAREIRSDFELVAQ